MEADKVMAALRICSGTEKCRVCPMQGEDECIRSAMREALAIIVELFQARDDLRRELQIATAAIALKNGELDVLRAQLTIQRAALLNWHEGHEDGGGETGPAGDGRMVSAPTVFGVKLADGCTMTVEKLAPGALTSNKLACGVFDVRKMAEPGAVLTSLGHGDGRL